MCSKKVLQFQVAAFMLSKGRLFVIILFKDAFTTKNYLSRKQPSMLKLGIHLNSNPPTPVCTSDTIFKADLRNDLGRGHKIFLLTSISELAAHWTCTTDIFTAIAKIYTHFCFSTVVTKFKSKFCCSLGTTDVCYPAVSSRAADWQ